MTHLNSTDDAGTLLLKLTEVTNEIGDLTKQLIEAGKVLNDAKGFYTEIKAKIKWKKEVANSLKVQIRAEANTLGSV